MFEESLDISMEALQISMNREVNDQKKQRLCYANDIQFTQTKFMGC